MANKYDSATSLEKAELHIRDARGYAANAGQNVIAAVGDVQTAYGLSSNGLQPRLKADDILAAAQVKATIALVQATLAVAHSNIGVYLYNKGVSPWNPEMWNDYKAPDPDTLGKVDNDGNPGSEEVPEATPEASE